MALDTSRLSPTQAALCTTRDPSLMAPSLIPAIKGGRSVALVRLSHAPQSRAAVTAKRSGAAVNDEGIPRGPFAYDRGLKMANVSRARAKIRVRSAHLFHRFYQSSAQ